VFLEQKGISREEAENVASKMDRKIVGETNGPEGKYWILE
jgi:hypothetical protein